ncbi:competence/damage-inducible protein A [Fodinicurvata sp. EGI_FJ10296]|uniref:competence/damage-inducible protein A n=1 Tax=Fodinicurvata sp. EGI_FJ10296 TaxID=3231908 RepID=UPI003452BE2B
MTSDTTVTACLLLIGNEILSGRTKDANLSWLAEALGAAGIRLREARVIPDDPEEIVAAVNHCRARYDHVFTTGGIGPTHDDITAGCIARAFGVPLERNADAIGRLERHYNDPSKLNEARLKMAEIPVGASLIDNPVSAAPGFTLENVHVLPGVPKIMQAMAEGLIKTLKGGRVMLSRTLVCRIMEGTVAETLGRVQAAHPDVEIGSYPYMSPNNAGVSLVFRCDDAAKLELAVAAMEGELKALDTEYRVE